MEGERVLENRSVDDAVVGDSTASATLLQLSCGDLHQRSGASSRQTCTCCCVCGDAFARDGRADSRGTLRFLRVPIL